MADAQVVERKLAVILAADVAEYSRLMGLDEVGTLRTLQAYRAILDRLIAVHHGRIFNTAGDSVMADFASPVDAVECAVAVQEAIAKANAERDVSEQMRFRIGVHLGDVIVDGTNLFGDGVNIAARLEALAEPGGRRRVRRRRTGGNRQGECRPRSESADALSHRRPSRGRHRRRNKSLR